MINTIAIANYRSLLNLIIPLGRLNIVTGANASGKSNLYRALRLLAEIAQGGVINALAREGGLSSTFWAGPETVSRKMQQRSVPLEGSLKRKAARLRLGFSCDDFGYSISLGLPTPSNSAFALDPEIKQETIWAGSQYRPSSVLINREGALIRSRAGRKWQVLSEHTSTFDSIFNQLGDPTSSPEVMVLKQRIQAFRFYDYFRVDAEAPARLPQLGTRTPVLHHDGRDLGAALQTIIEIGDVEALSMAISDAFPGARLHIDRQEGGQFVIQFFQEGLLRPLTGLELSDGTLRYLLWVAVLLTPRPPPLMVLNEPETSLHPDLLPALARLIIHASESTQVWVVSHASRLVAALEQAECCHSIALHKDFGQTSIPQTGLLDAPSWHWPDKNR